MSGHTHTHIHTHTHTHTHTTTSLCACVPRVNKLFEAQKPIRIIYTVESHLSERVGTEGGSDK